MLVVYIIAPNRTCYTTTMNEQIEKISNWLGTGSINIFGLPFAGKDTQGEKLAELFDGELIAGGDILRHHHEPKEVEQIMAAGGMVPSEFYYSLILPFLSQKRFAGKPLILSTVGRKSGEESIVLETAEKSGHPIKAAILLTLDDNVAWKRFEAAKTTEHDRGNRSDDSEQTLRNRLQEFRDETMPVIDFYRQRGLLVQIDGEPSREQVTSEILESLAKLATA